MGTNRLNWIAVVFLTVFLTGCYRSSPDLRVDPSHETPTAGGPEVLKQIGPNAKIVTGEPATTASDDPTAEDAKTAEDRTGAVAVKMEY